MPGLFPRYAQNFLRIDFVLIIRILVLEDPTTPDDIGSSQRILHEAIVLAIAPTPSVETITAFENSKKKRKRVQASFGEVLACDEVIERLRIEEEKRDAKKSKSRVPKAKSVQVKLFNAEIKKMNPQVNHLIKRRMIQNVLYVIVYGVVTKERSQISGLYLIFVVNIAVLSVYLLIQIFLMIFTVQNVWMNDFCLNVKYIFLKHFTVPLYQCTSLLKNLWCQKIKFLKINCCFFIE